MWKVYGKVLETAEINGSSKLAAMKIKMNSNCIVMAIRTWFVIYNSPVFTSLGLRIYEDQGGVAGKLIATSINSFAPSDLYTDPYAHKGVYFEFDKIALKSTPYYHILPYAIGYTGTDSSHLAWSKAFPDPEYREGLPLTYESMHVSPYRLAIVGSPL